jgi:hypothetical protein
VSRTYTTRGEVSACWRNTAKLLHAAGKVEEAKQASANAKLVAGINGWLARTGRS